MEAGTLLESDTEKMAKFILKHQLALGVALTLIGAVYVTYGVVGRLPWDWFVGWNADMFAVPWQKTLVRLGATLAPLFYGCLFVGVFFLYMEHLNDALRGSKNYL
jgi:hypothetical protein